MCARLALALSVALGTTCGAALPALAAPRAAEGEPYYVPPPEPPAAPGAPAYPDAAPAAYPAPPAPPEGEAPWVAARPMSRARAAVERALLPFRRQVGLGARVIGAVSGNGIVGFGQGGVAVDLLLRAHPYLTTELSLQYLGTGQDSGGYARGDVPLLLGQRVSLRGPGKIAAPYLVAAVGVSYAQLSTPGGADQGFFVDGQAGAGLEVRLGRHVALGLDLRVAGKLRVDQGPRLIAFDDGGQPRELLGSQLGATGSLTAAGFF